MISGFEFLHRYYCTRCLVDNLQKDFNKTDIPLTGIDAQKLIAMLSDFCQDNEDEAACIVCWNKFLTCNDLEDF